MCMNLDGIRSCKCVLMLLFFVIFGRPILVMIVVYAHFKRGNVVLCIIM